VLHFNAIAEVIPFYPDKLYLFTSETRLIVLLDAENRTILCSFFGQKNWKWRKDGRIDRGTDRIALASL